MFNRYDGADGMHFGTHVDGAVRLLPGTGVKIRTDVSATLFLSAPEDVRRRRARDRGHLRRARRQAAGRRHGALSGDAAVHRVTPVTRGARLASFFWVQSMVRDDAQRALLFDLDMAIVRLTQDAPGHASLVSLTGCYHNLLRMWAEPMMRIPRR